MAIAAPVANAYDARNKDLMLCVNSLKQNGYTN